MSKPFPVRVLQFLPSSLRWLTFCMRLTTVDREVLYSLSITADRFSCASVFLRIFYFEDCFVLPEFAVWHKICQILPSTSSTSKHDCSWHPHQFRTICDLEESLTRDRCQGNTIKERKVKAGQKNSIMWKPTLNTWTPFILSYSCGLKVLDGVGSWWHTCRLPISHFLHIPGSTKAVIIYSHTFR
jgi:hypothetical protein